MEYAPLATELNEILEQGCPIAYDSLSERGKRMYFPYKGILGQTAEAEGSKINATIGIALNERESPLVLPSISGQFSHDPRETLTYASSFGKKELREKWHELMKKKNPSLHCKTSVPVVTNGITHGLDVVGSLFINPGDHLIVTNKYWGNYKLLLHGRYGAEFQEFNTFEGEGFDTGAFEEALVETPGQKKIVLLNFPNNPSGYAPTEHEAEEIISILVRRAEAGDKLCVILDDAYFGLVYQEGIYKESLFARLADAHENILAIKLDGASKEEYVWGLRVCFITFASKSISAYSAEALEYKAAGTVRATVSNISNLSQTTILQSLNSANYEAEKKEKYELLKKRFEEVRRVLSDPTYSEYYTALPFNAGYFMCVEMKNGLNAEDVRRNLLRDHDCGVIATGNLIRIAYSSLPTAHIEPLFNRLNETCSIITESQKVAMSEGRNVLK